MDKKLAWIHNDFGFIGSFDWGFKERGYEIDCFRTADEALRGLDKVKYDAVLADLYIAPGLEMNDPVIRGIMADGGLHSEYLKIGLRFIELVKQEGRLNADTPLIATSNSYPGWVPTPDLRQESLGRGAVDYILWDNVNGSGLRERVEEALRQSPK